MNTKQLLVVDDDIAIINLLEIYLKDTADTIFTALNGEEALKILKREGNGINLVVSDIKMPIMDGVQFFKQAIESKIDTPFTFFTAFGDDQTISELKDLGAQDIVEKPNFKKLKDIVKSFFDGMILANNIETNISALKKIVSPKRYTVLAVDDNQTNLDIISELLEYNDIDVVTEIDPQKTLEHIKTNKFDLVLLDIMMPIVSGFDLLKSIRETHSQIELPVIMVTAKDQDDDIVKALDLGANDYILKPINFKITMARIHTQQAVSLLASEMGKAREMEAINAMIATYNHEIKNPLTVVNMVMKLMIEDPEVFNKYKNELNQMETASNKIEEIVNEVKNFSVEKLGYATYCEDTKMVSLNGST